MKKYFILLGVTIISCNKVQTPTNEVISNFKSSSDTVFADGITIDTLTVKLNNEADSNERNVLFTTSIGNFLKGMNGTCTNTAYYYNNNLTANAYYVAPLIPGIIYFTASPANPNFNVMGNYLLMDTITVVPSVADTIILQSSSFGIESNYQSVLTLKGILQNSLAHPVSPGTNVIFESYLPNGSPINGQFELANTKSDSTSSVNATFSIGIVPVATVFFIKVTVLDSLGNKTNIKDSISITVTQ